MELISYYNSNNTITNYNLVNLENIYVNSVLFRIVEKLWTESKKIKIELIKNFTYDNETMMFNGDVIKVEYKITMKQL